jgi:hypothetical protein
MTRRLYERRIVWLGVWRSHHPMYSSRRIPPHFLDKMRRYLRLCQLSALIWCMWVPIGLLLGQVLRCL